MPLSYRQVKDLYDTLQDSGATSKSLPQWAGEMNALTDSDLYNEGLNDNFIKRGSVALDRGIESIPGLVSGSRDAGQFLGGLVGMPEEGAHIGEGLPRMAANFLPVMGVAGIEAATGGAATPFIVGAGLAGSSALQGAQTYTETNSPGAGLLSGATAALLPGITGKVEGSILARLGAKEVAGPLARGFSKLPLGQGMLGPLEQVPNAISKVSQRFGNPVQSALSFLGGQGAAALTMGASDVGQSLLAGQGLKNPFNSEMALNLTLGQLPFSLLHLGTKALGLGKSSEQQAEDLQKSIDLTRQGMARKEAYDQANAKTPIEQVQNVQAQKGVSDPKIQEEIDARLANLGIQREAIKANPTPENIGALNSISQEENELIEKSGGVGIGLAPKKIQIIGENHYFNPGEEGNSGSHFINVSNVPENAGLTYPDGSPVSPGDRVQISDGRYPSELNHDSTNRFEASPKWFRKAQENQAYDPSQIPTPEQARWASRGEGKKLPDGQVADPLGEGSSSAITQFTTSKGSVYQIHEDGTTTRDKSIHPEHPGDEGIKPRSSKTFYLTEEESRQLGAIQAKGVKMSIQKRGDQYGVRFEEGPNKGKFIPSSLVTPKEIPAVGLRPVELWEGHSQPHFGNTITEVKQGQINSNLPIQQTSGLDFHRQNIKDLQDAKQITKNASTYGEAIVGLVNTNLVREQAGLPQIDLATLKEQWESKQGKGQTPDDIRPAIVALVDETSRFEEIDAQGKLDALQKEVDTQTGLHEAADKEDAAAKEILEMYAKQADRSGRRLELAVDSDGQSLYWRKVAELQAQGRTNKQIAREMAQWKEGSVISSGEGLKGKKQEKLEPPKEINQALNGDQAMKQLGAEMVMKVTSGDRNSDEARVLRQLIYNEAFGKGLELEDVIQAAIDSKVADEGPDANIFAEDWLQSPKVKMWMKELGQAKLRNEQGPRANAPKEPFVSSEKEVSLVKSLSTDGQGLLEPLLQSEEPLHKALAQDWTKNFPELLKTISGKLEGDSGTWAQRNELDNGVTINFDPSTLGLSKLDLEKLKIHEIAHGLTMKLLDTLPKDDPRIVKLEEIRQKAIANLPKDLKEAWEKVGNSQEWLEKNQNDSGTSVWESLAPTPEGRQILYGLMNHDELTAQTYYSRNFRDFLQKVPGKTNLWKSFLNWTRELLGLGMNVKDSALGEIIQTTHQIMSQGEFLAKAQDFGHRYFEGLGKGGTYGESQTQRGLQLMAEGTNGISSEELIRSLGASQDRFNPTLDRAQRKLENYFKEPSPELDHLNSVLGELGHEGSSFGVDDLIESALGENRDLESAMDILPQEVTDYIFSKLDDHKDVLQMVKAAVDSKNQGLLNIANPQTLKEPVEKGLSAIEKMLKNRDKQKDYAEKLIQMNAVEPQAFRGRSAAAPKIVSELLESTKEGAASFGKWIQDTLEPTGQWAQRNPEVSEILSKGFELVPNSRKMFTDWLKGFGTDNSSDVINPGVTHDAVQAFSKTVSNPKLLKAFNRWIYWNQKEGGAAVTMLPESHPEITKELSKLTPDERNQVQDAVVAHGITTQTGHGLVLDYMTKVAAQRGAALAGTYTGFKTKDNVSLSDTLLRGLLKMTDPMTQWQGQTEIQSVQQKFAQNPEGFLDLLKYTQGEADKISSMKKYFDANPNWSSAQRTEQYLINGFKGGKPWLGQASSIAEAKEIAAKENVTLDRTNPFTDQWKGREDEPFQFTNMPPETLARMQEIEANQIQMLKSRGLLSTPEELAEFQQSSVVSQILRESDQQQNLGDLIPPARRLSKGAEDLPWIWNHISYAQKQSNYWSRQLLRAQARTYLRDPEMVNAPDVQKKLATHFENLLSPDPQLAQKMNRFASVWFMGFNLASSLINMAQPFTTHMAELTNISGKPLDSYLRTTRALKEAGGISLGGKEWATPEHTKFMSDAAQDGEIGLSMYDNDAQAQEGAAMNYKRAMMKNKVQSIGQKLSTAGGAYSDAAMWVFKHGEQLNAKAALLSSFDLYREQGLSYEEAKQKAYQFNHAVNYSGGRAQRSVGLFSGRGDFPRTAAMLGTSLQSYTLGTTFQIARYLQKGLFRPNGVTPHEVFAARKAAIQMLGTQFAAAGALGMPFVSGAISLLDKLFPELELNRKIREGMNSFLSSDNENGSPLTDIAMTGVPSMLGWDLQSRLSMGNTLPGVSEVNGFQPENLIGPAANLVRNFVGGVQGWAKGDLSATAKFVPKGLMNFVNAGQKVLSGDSSIQDYRGVPIANPTPGEQLGQLLGFQPERLSDQNAAARILSQSQTVESERNSRDNQELANEVLKGNFGTVRQQILQKANLDKSYNPVNAMQSIVRSAEELNFPRDLRREGNSNTAGTRSSLLSSFSNLSNGSPSEMDRFMWRQGLEQKLGVPQGNSKSGLEMAQLMDSLKAAQPGATRSELKIAAQQALRRKMQQNMLLQPQE